MIIKTAIDEELQRIKARFCTPGHKGRLHIRDITETDTFPQQCITQSQNKTAQILNVSNVRFLTNGSSMGIKAALLGGGAILATGNAHPSIRQAAQLGNQPYYTIANDIKNGLSLPLTEQSLALALNSHPDIKTVVLTSPDYYGLTTSVKVGELVKKYNKTLYVDAAHGAHFLFRPDLFDCELLKIADAFNVSAHKTLPAYTQTAYLIINNSLLLDRIDSNLLLLGTTSPLYPLYEGLEYAAIYTHDNKCHYDILKQETDALRQEIVCVNNNDFTRLVVDANALGLSGKQLYTRLQDRGVVAEKYDTRYVIFIVSIGDGAEDIRYLKDELCKTGVS